MIFPFNPNRGPIPVVAEVSGPSGRLRLRLLLDTGATTSLIDAWLLASIGYDPDASIQRVQVTTGSGVESVPLVVLTRLTALGQDRVGLSVLAHTLPPDAGVDGLLGLDFLRGQILTLDFRGGLIDLA